MSESFDIDETERFTTGTVGPKGQRVFYLQVHGDQQVLTLRLEKQQVAALAEYLVKMLDDLPEIDVFDTTTDLELREPIDAAWTVGSMGVAYEESRDRIVLYAEELLADDEEDASPAQARIRLRREQVPTFIGRARDVVSSGRTPCRWCGSPLQPELEPWCACAN